MTKLKDLRIKSWPEKEKGEGLSNDQPFVFGKVTGFNQALDIINNLEFNPADYVELDVEKVEEGIKQVCLKITPDFDGLIFIKDSFNTPPNNWTRISIKTLAQAIVDSKDVVKAKKEIKK